MSNSCGGGCCGSNVEVSGLPTESINLNAPVLKEFGEEVRTTGRSENDRQLVDLCDPIKADTGPCGAPSHEVTTAGESLGDGFVSGCAWEGCERGETAISTFEGIAIAQQSIQSPGEGYWPQQDSVNDIDRDPGCRDKCHGSKDTNAEDACCTKDTSTIALTDACSEARITPRGISGPAQRSSKPTKVSVQDHNLGSPEVGKSCCSTKSKSCSASNTVPVFVDAVAMGCCSSGAADTESVPSQSSKKVQPARKSEPITCYSLHKRYG